MSIHIFSIQWINFTTLVMFVAYLANCPHWNSAKSSVYVIVECSTCKTFIVIWSKVKNSWPIYWVILFDLLHISLYKQVIVSLNTKKYRIKPLFNCWYKCCYCTVVCLQTIVFSFIYPGCVVIVITCNLRYNISACYISSHVMLTVIINPLPLFCLKLLSQSLFIFCAINVQYVYHFCHVGTFLRGLSVD